MAVAILLSAASRFFTKKPSVKRAAVEADGETKRHRRDVTGDDEPTDIVALSCRWGSALNNRRPISATCSIELREQNLPAKTQTALSCYTAHGSTAGSIASAHKLAPRRRKGPGGWSPHFPGNIG